MNKHCYRVIYSKTLQRLVVVSELAKAENPSSSNSRVGDNNTVTKGHLVSIKALTLALFTALGFVWTPLSFADNLEIHPDKSAPGNQCPAVLKTANGIPQVNIQTPNAKGLSHNKYRQFDVAEKGAILNNARKNTQTQLAGWVQGNPNLARGEANVILNEVNASKPSQLKGYIEVAGKKADVIIANPSGLHCEGCGVINAGRVQLTTGQVNVEGGEVKGFTVKKGTVHVAERGLDASNADYTDIIAKKVKLDGGIWAKELKVTTGTNQVDSHNNRVVYVGDKTQSAVDSKKAAQYSVDVSELGGMYAGKIRLVDSDHGLGVRNAGHIGAQAGDVVIDSQGRIVNSGFVGATENVNLEAAHHVENRGSVFAQNGTVTIKSQQKNIIQDGVITAKSTKNNQVNLSAPKGKITQTGQTLTTGDIQYQGSDIAVSPQATLGAGLVFSQTDNEEKITQGKQHKDGHTVILSADKSADIQGHINAPGFVTISSQKTHLNHSQISSYELNASSSQGDLSANQSHITTTRNILLSTPQSLLAKGSQFNAEHLFIDAKHVNKSKGTWAQRSRDDLRLDFEDGLDNNNGQISTLGHAIFTGSQLSNASGTFIADSFNITTPEFINRQGKLIKRADQAATLTITGELNNKDGVIGYKTVASDEVGNDNGQSTVPSSNTQPDGNASDHGNSSSNVVSPSEDGSAKPSHATQIKVTQRLDNQSGELLLGLGMALSGEGTLTNSQGAIRAKTFDWKSKDGINNASGDVFAQESLALTGHNLNNQSGKLHSQGTLILSTEQVNNHQGLLQSQGDLTLDTHRHDVINTDTLEQNTSTKGIISGGKLTLTSGNIDNTQGLILSKDTLTLSAKEVKNHHGKIESQDTLSLSASSFSQLSGILQASKALTLTSYSFIHSKEGSHVEANSVTLSAKSDFDNSNSELIANKSIKINSTGLDNQYGVINSKEENAYINTSERKLDNFSGLINANQALEIKSGEINNDKGLLQGGQSIDIDTHNQSLSNQNTLSKKNDLGIISQGLLTLKSGDLDNHSGLIFSTAKQVINADGINNERGVILSLDEQHLSLTHQLHNLNGRVSSSTTQQIHADEIDNTQGTVHSLGSSELVAQQGLKNHSGTIFANDMLTLTATGVSNEQGNIISQSNEIRLDSRNQQLDNRYGTIKAFDSIDAKTGNLNNTEGRIGSLRSDVKIDSHGEDINNTKGRIEALKLLHIDSGLFNNEQGTVYSEGGIRLNTHHHNLINTQSQTESGIQSKGDISLLELNNLNNQQGLVRADGTVHIAASDIDNQRNGFISGNTGLTITAHDVHNQTGTLSSQRDSTITLSGVFDNTANTQAGSLLNVTDQLTLNADVILNENTKADSQKIIQGIAANRILLETSQLLNQQGGIYAQSAVDATVARIANNRAGEIVSTGDVTVKGAALTLDNQDGKIESVNKLTLKVNQLDGEGRIASKGDAEININQDYIVTKSFDVEGVLSLSAKNLENRTQLTTSPAKGITISTGLLTNTRTASIEASNTTIHAQDFDNRGLINGDNTFIDVKNNMNNVGSGRIYGDTLGIKATSLNNLNENDQSAIIAARERLDIGVQTLVNEKDSELMSLGGLYIGGDLDEQHHATGQANAVYNKNALIQSEGEMSISAKTLENRHDYLKTELQITDQKKVTEYQGEGAVERYLEGTPGLEIYEDESDHLRVPDGRTYEEWYRYHYLKTTQQDIVLPSQYQPGRIFSGGLLTFNGDKFLNKDSQVISANKIDIVGGKLDQKETKGRKIVTKAGCNPGAHSDGCQALSPELKGYTKPEDSIPRKFSSGEYGLHHYWRNHPKGRDDTGHRRDDYTPAQEISNGEDLGVYAYKEYALPTFETMQDKSLSPTNSVSIDARDIDTVGEVAVNGIVSAMPTFNFINEHLSQVSVKDSHSNSSEIASDDHAPAMKDNSVIRTLSPDVSLPRSSLFVLNPSADKHVLIETDPAFTRYKQWLSSDYMFNMLRIDPQNMHKRLGDGYYEQQLIRNQIAKLTGRLYLSHYQSQEEQYKALMNNGVSFAKKFNYTLGTALSADQIANLTSDIVWLVNKTVTLPNGKTQDVLVPQVYVMTTKGAVDGSGAIISGAETDIHTDTLTNSGTIAGRDLASIHAKTITNQFGRLSGRNLVADATQDIQNLGGQLDAEQSLYAHAGRHFISKTTTTTVTNEKGESTTLDKQARIMLTGDNGRSMIVRADQDLNLTATDLKTASTSALTLLDANRDVILDTARTSHRYDSITDSDNYQKNADYTDQGSTIETKGYLQITAGRDANLKQATLASDNTVLVKAERDIHLTTGEAHRYSEGASKHSSSGTFSSKTYASHALNEDTTVQGTEMTGNKVILSAGKNIDGEAVAIDGVRGVAVLAQEGDVTFSAGTNTYRSLEEHKETKHGLFSGGGPGFTIGSQSQSDRFDEKGAVQSSARSVVGSSGGGDVIIAGKGKVTTIGTDVIAQDGNKILFQGNKIKAEAGKDIIESTENHEFKQSGLTVSVSSPVTDMAQAATQSIKRSQEVKNPRLAKLYQLKAAQEATLAAKALPDTVDTIKHIIADTNRQEGDVSNPQVKLSIGYGEQKSQSSSHTTQVTHSGSVHQAGHVIYKATGDADDSIAILGSDIRAKEVEYNTPGGVKLAAMQDTLEHHSKNSSSSASAGVFVGANGNSYGIGVEGAAQVGKGHENESRVTQYNTHVDAEKTVFNVGKSVEQSGAVIRTDRVSGTIGGDLIQNSLQDTVSYENKQKQAGAQGSVAIYGSGSSASANASLSNVKADSAQVTEQTGLFIGKEGMDLTVGGKLKTKGGAITSSAPAEKNHLRVAGIEAENIENHSYISVENASVGVSTQMGANVANAIGAGLNALTNVHDNDHTTTRSTVGSNITLDVGDGNIPTALSRDASNSNQQVKQFDKQDYQERAEMAQVISAVSDNTITLTLKPKLDDAEKVLNNDKATEAEKAQARQVVETYGKGSDLQLAIRAVTAAAQGLATGSEASAAVGGASPLLNKAIKQATTDENGQVNRSANILAHAVLGAAEALATGNNALAGAAGAATGEVAAKLITEQLYNTTPDKLSEAQKDTVSALSQLASGLSGVLAGDNTGSGITAAKSGKSAVENNLLSNWDSEELLKILNKFDQNGALSTFEQEKAMSLLLKDSEIDRLIQLHQKNPDALTDSQKSYLYREVKNIANSYPNLTASDVLNWDFSANTVKRDNTKIIHYLNNENLLANTVEHRISEGVYEGMQYMPFTPGFLKAGQTGLSLIQKGAVGTKEALNTMGQWAAQHPKTAETIVAGTVSTGFDIYNGNVTPEGVAMNYAVAGAMAGKSLGKQLAIATSYQALTSGNDSSKSPDWLAMDIATKGISVGMSFGTTKALNNLGFGKTWPVFFGDFIGNYMENYNKSNITEDKK